MNRIFLACFLLMMTNLFTCEPQQQIPQQQQQQHQAKPSSVVNLCDGISDKSPAWYAAASERYRKNYIIEKGFIEVRSVNASTFQECLRMCCDKVNCNYAFLKDSHQCYLIVCPSDQACHPVLNRAKHQNDPIDHLIHVRSVGDSKSIIKSLVNQERNELSKLESSLAAAGVSIAIEKNPECIPTVKLANNSPCPTNEICMKMQQAVDTASGQHEEKEIHECVCPAEIGMHRVDGVCREYLPNMPGCMMFLNECGENKQPSNQEECVIMHAGQVEGKHGTCQCRVGFRRDLDSMKCIPAEIIEKKMTEMPKNIRRRPSPPVSLENIENEEKESKKSGKSMSLWNTILQELGMGAKKTSQENEKDEKPTNKILSALDKIAHEIEAKTTSTSTSTTTTTTTTSTSTEAPNIHTNNLFANAGHDIHVYYPSKMCVLNGTNTRFVPKSSNDFIIRWMWVKADSSPAFGQFVNTNEGPVVVYEQMVEGVYKFLLRVFTNSKEYSQSTVHVYVHSTLNSNRTSSSSKSSISSSKYRQERELNENVILIELDVAPSMFTEYLKEHFLEKFQQMLDEHRKQFRLTKPRVVLLNTRIVAPLDYSTKSSVVLELIVTDLVQGESSSLTQNEFELPSVITNGVVVNDEIDLVGENRRIVDNSNLIRLMRRHQNVFRFSFNNMNAVWKYFGKAASDSALKPVVTTSSNNNPNNLNYYSLLDSLDIKVRSVSKLTCTSDFYASATPHANSYNCSNHGKCDFNSHKCICNKYWMPNLYLKYLDYESDLTNGNNCEYNIPLFVVCCILFVFLTFMLIKLIFKYFFYYIFCCCLCKRGKNERKGGIKNRFGGRKLNANDSYLNEDDLNTSETSDLIKSKVKTLKKPFGGTFSNGGSSSGGKGKYSLLRNEENDSITWRGASRPSNGVDLNDDDEEVIYDESSVRNSRLQLNSSNSTSNMSSSMRTTRLGGGNNTESNVKKYSVI